MFLPCLKEKKNKGYLSKKKGGIPLNSLKNNSAELSLLKQAR